MPITTATTKKKKKIQRSLQDYISKIKKQQPQTPQLPLHSTIFSPCNHPKTPSLGGTPPGDVDGFLSQNFKSLYIKEEDDDKDDPGEIPRKLQDEAEECRRFGEVVLFDSPRLIYPPLNLRGSKRFFVPPGSSGRSLMEEARSSLATSSSEDFGSSSTSSTTTNTFTTTAAMVTTTAMDRPPGREGTHTGKGRLPDDCIAVVTRTRCPYGEFKRSMQEVVESHADGTLGGEVDWEFMEEMLMCYLNLNERKSHKYVLSAFVDLVVSLRRRRDPINAVTSRSRDVQSNKKRDNI